MNIWNRIKDYFSSLFAPAETWDQHVWTDEELGNMLREALSREMFEKDCV